MTHILLAVPLRHLFTSELKIAYTYSYNFPMMYSIGGRLAPLVIFSSPEIKYPINARTKLLNWSAKTKM